MDFSKVKEWQIPEGKVARVSVGGLVIWQAKTQAEQLTAPTISLDGPTLTMTATDDRTEEFVIFVDGVETATVANTISFTLSVSEANGEIISTQTVTAVDGMTWREWVETTDYEHEGFRPTVSGSYVILQVGDTFYLKDGATYSDTNRINVDEVIQSNTTYYFVNKSK